LPMHVRLQPRYCASADALTEAGLADRRREAGLATDGSSMVPISAIVLVPATSQQDTSLPLSAA